MQAIDYSKLLDCTAVHSFLPSEATLDEALYERGQGIQFHAEGRRRMCLENVRLAECAFLLASQDTSGEVLNYRQCVKESDWVHMQFRLDGGGWEDIAQTGVMQTPGRSCIVSRYPENSVVERSADATNGWKVACLFIAPAALTYLLDVPASRLPDHAMWLVHETHAQPRSIVLPLQSSMVFAVNDILSCTFRGCNRRAYMLGKSLELLSTVIHALGRSWSTAEPALKLSASDLERIGLARSLMCARLESSLTLSDLARKTGLNRTKLALGFKSVYGVSVQAFWRDKKLDHARQLLSQDQASVTEVALSVGYSELSSFTRAFTRRFGMTPRQCKGRRTLNRD